MISLNLDTQPKFLRPELLTHPTIPKDLHGVNPRTIKGQEWWDEQRKIAYRANNYCCWACGAYSLDTGQPLEAHEAYTYDFEHRVATFVEIVALCKDCHSFIHCGRAYHLSTRSTRAAFRQMMERGLKLLGGAGLTPSAAQLGLTVSVLRRREYLGAYIEGMRKFADECGKGTWKLIFEGGEYTYDRTSTRIGD